jgi:hypothetical protein
VAVEIERGGEGKGEVGVKRKAEAVSFGFL